MTDPAMADAPLWGDAPEQRVVWVTGAGGFIGRAACEALHVAGFDVIRLVWPDPGAEVRGPDWIVCDLVEGPPAIPSAGSMPSTLVHLAAEIPPAFEGAEAERTARRNREMDDNVFDFCGSVGAGVVFASSGSVYGEGRGQVFAEDGTVDPRGPYAAGKLRSEQRGGAVLAASGVPFTALRISAPYGPGQGTRTVIQHFLRRAMAGEGLEYHGSGSRMQDFVYVGDVAEAIVRSVRTAGDGVFNIASGQPVSMRDLAATVADVAGGGVSVGPSGQADEQEGLTASYAIDAAARVLGWSPATTLAAGLTRWRDHLAAEEER